MIHTTQGIVLHSLRYSDTSLIARILTRNFGLQSYLIPGVYKSRAKIKAGLFHPFAMIEMVCYHKDREGLQRIKEIRHTQPLHGIMSDIRKSSVAIFLSEIMLGAFRNQEPQKEAFEFISKAIQRLDMLEENIGLFHIIFLLQLSKYLGFSPSAGYTEKACHFNIREGLYQDADDHTGACMTPGESYFFYLLSTQNNSGQPDIKVPADIKKKLLYRVVDYYRHHMDGLRELRSIEILSKVFSE